MKFNKLFDGVEVLEILGEDDFDVLQITDQSQKVEKGSLFFVVKGNSFDGSEFLKEVESTKFSGLSSKSNPLITSPSYPSISLIIQAVS